MAAKCLEDRLKRVEAHQAIENLIARYAHGADRKNAPDIMRPLFAEDAKWSAAGFEAFHGAAAIADGLAGIAKDQVVWSIHYMTSPYIIVSNDTEKAECSWYLWELCTMRDDDSTEEKDQWLGGWYEAVVMRFGEEWRFTSVYLDIRVQGEAQPPWAMKKPVLQNENL